MSQASVSSARAKTVLLAEDDDILRQAVRDALEAQGYRVLEAQTGAQALTLAEAAPGSIDLLIADVGLPDILGTVLAEQIVARHPESRVLFMTGYGRHALREHGERWVGHPVLEKPFLPSALLRAVRELLGRE